jgi:hypothetical protein
MVVNMAEEKIKSASASVGTQGITEIHAHETNRRYKLVDLNNREIEQTAGEIVEASKLLSNRKLWIDNFKAVVTRVRAWCEQYKNHVQVALVDIRSDKVIFYFVPQSESYDLTLGDAMTALEIEIGGGSGIGCVESLQVPLRSIERFVGEKSLQVWPTVALGE